MKFKSILLFALIGALLISGPIFSEASDRYEIRQNTPEVQKAIDGRRDRSSVLKELKAKKEIGEDRYGHVSNLSGLPAVQQVVDSENYDRELIYQAIVDQNNLGSGAIETVRSVFAQVRRDKAEKGDKIQMPSGEWIEK